MRYSIVASALLGAGAALAPVDTGLTCQLPPNELLVGSEQCQGGLLDAKTVLACHTGWDASRGGLLSLSKDATACILTGFEALQVHDLHVRSRFVPSPRWMLAREGPCLVIRLKSMRIT
ncbi:hypothetical protein VDBG_05397 [Verticillium alfalfae VaMs.102]|uniref:Uncharacterized protein n=1 Tax=Verticillium alfalfae (strain VaMs.102 / ATCC MYA-4576 / FGSC 10136) TaxID=526221 RepID=C9SKS0_VERA1|nr:hypothetical protein VDBG_05397 [Verticillium alfalfae VaMs.102]EEY19288.1 hypothetical protein VDBG_05397 [Verticillium alfalfae VaMs.102]